MCYTVLMMGMRREIRVVDFKKVLTYLFVEGKVEV